MMKIKQNFLVFLTLIAFFALTTFSANNAGALFAQTDGWKIFKKFPKLNTAFPHARIDQFYNLIYLPNIRDGEFRVLNFHGEERVFTSFGLGLDGSAGISSLSPFVFKFGSGWGGGASICYPHLNGSAGSIFLITKFDINNPQMEHITFEDFFGIPKFSQPSQADCPAAVQFMTFDGMNTWCYIDTRWNGALKFVAPNKPDSVIATYDFPEYVENADGTSEGFQVILRTKMVFAGWPNTPDLFFKPYFPDATATIVRFNTQTKQFHRYLVKDLPLVYEKADGATDTTFVFSGSAENICGIKYSSWMLKIVQYAADNSRLRSDNMFLTYTPIYNEGFKSVRMNPGNVAKYWIDGEGNVPNFGRLNDSIIFFTYTNSDPLSYREIITYDVVNGKYGSIVIPSELVAEKFDITSVRELRHTDGYNLIGVLLSTGHFLFYDPAVSVEETESIFQEIGIRNFYPNPVTHGFAKVEIMCYVDDINTLYVGLYDFMGKKVLDLGNHFEYEPATATIHISFDIPKSLSKGSYFLVVRSGTETRTRGIIVGE